MNQHHFGAYDPTAAAAGFNQRTQYQQQQQQRSQPHAPNQELGITSPTLRDVLNGRGQGVQRHPGNVKYRTLVFVNKGLYAKCPRSDKIKISKGIVAAVRELGGRFLELDERSGIYNDIGDKKATEKTSQALREGQTEIRKQMYNDEKRNGGAQTYDTSLLASSMSSAATAATSNVTNGGSREVSAEGYFGYSVQVLESLYLEDESALHEPHPTSVSPQSIKPQTIASSYVPSNPAAFAPAPSSDANTAAIARALEQFPGSAAALAAPEATTTMQPSAPQQTQPGVATRSTNQSRASEMRPSLGRFTDELGRPSLSRLTNMSIASMFSLTQMLESARNDPNRDRGSIESVLSDEIRDLIRLSAPQLAQVEQKMNIDEDVMHEDKEVSVLFDEDTMKDRVSELRFTDVSRDHGGGDHLREPNPRRTDSTDSTNYSKSSLMDSSMMTFGTEDMSVHSLSDKLDKRKRRSAKGGSDDRETAGLLLRLSNENHGKSH